MRQLNETQPSDLNACGEYWFVCIKITTEMRSSCERRHSFAIQTTRSIPINSWRYSKYNSTTNSTDSMLFDLVHKWSLTCIAHVLDLLKINWIEFPHIAMTAAHDTPQRSPAVYSLPDSHNKLASPFIFHRHVYSSPHSSSRLDPPLLASWYHTLVIQSLP